MGFYGLYFVVIHLFLCVRYALFSDHARGWFWYEDPDIDSLEHPQKEEKKEEVIATPKGKTARERLKDVTEHLEEMKARAILEPTREHVKAYQEMQMKVVNQSESFSKAWNMNVYYNPSLDENVRNPSAQGARFIVYEEERKETERIVSKLKDRYGFFYFFSGNCSYCKAFGPVLKHFADHYGFEVMAISLDGSPSDVFPNWQVDNGLSKQWNVQMVPSVFAINPEENHVIPVANGFTAIDAMEKRIVSVVKGRHE